jgi:hypothetical protein
MKTKHWIIIGLAASTGSGFGPASADPRPLLVPAHDVTVHYQVAPREHAPVDVVVAVKAGGTRLRITSDMLPTTVLVNRDTEKAAVMLPMLRAYSDIKIGRYDPENTVLKGAAFTRGGHEHVAGHECTVWRATSADGSAEGCITADGVILRAAVRSDKHGEEVALHAVRVDYAPVPDADFAVPPDFQRSPFKLSVDGLGK